MNNKVSEQVVKLLGDKPKDITEPKNDVLTKAKQRIKSICKSLTIDVERYNPAKTVNSIQSYINDREKNDRLLYSQISAHIYELDEQKRGTFSHNVEKLAQYVLSNENELNDDCRKIAIKIYDHFNLANSQIDNVKNIAGNIVNEVKESVKESVKEDVKHYEREYITILGIFASIVLGFVGGSIFSSSALENIDKGSIYRLLFVLNFIAFAVSNLIHRLILFILSINGKSKDIKICGLNVAFAVIAFLIIISWAVKFETFDLWFQGILNGMSQN